MSDTSLVASFYNQNATNEHSRLLERRLEHTVTMRVILDAISRFHTDEALKIADIGGGTGRYGILVNSSFLHGVTYED